MSYLCTCAAPVSLKRGNLKAYLKWLETNKHKTGRLNHSKAITFGMPAGRGRKGERQPRSRCGKHTTNNETPCHARQIFQTEKGYTICTQHKASQVLPLIKHRRIHSTQLCLIHQAILLLEHDFINHNC